MRPWPRGAASKARAHRPPASRPAGRRERTARLRPDLLDAVELSKADRAFLQTLAAVELSKADRAFLQTLADEPAEA